MVGSKGTHGTGRFIRRLQMRRALGIQSSHKMRHAASDARRRDCCPGSWWDREKQCVAIEGQDFAQDTREGGAGRFEFIPDSDEEGVNNGPSFTARDDEFVPDTEPQDIVTVSKGRPCFGNMLHEWLQIIEVKEQQCAREIATSEQNELTTCSKDQRDLKSSAKEDEEDKGNPKVEKVNEDNTMEELHQNVSFSDMETDDEASWVEAGVDLRGHSQVEEDSWVQDEEDSHVEGDDFKDKVNDLIIAIFPACKDVLRSAKP